MIDPEQAEFRRQLRARTRPPVSEPDDWRPHPSWAEKKSKGKPGPPRQPNPSSNLIAVRKYRDKLKALRDNDTMTP